MAQGVRDRLPHFLHCWECCYSVCLAGCQIAVEAITLGASLPLASEIWRDGPGAFKDPDEKDPDERYKMLYFARGNSWRVVLRMNGESH